MRFVVSGSMIYMVLKWARLNLFLATVSTNRRYKAIKCGINGEPLEDKLRHQAKHYNKYEIIFL